MHTCMIPLCYCKLRLHDKGWLSIHLYLRWTNKLAYEVSFYNFGRLLNNMLPYSTKAFEMISRAIWSDEPCRESIKTSIYILDHSWELNSRASNRTAQCSTSGATSSGWKYFVESRHISSSCVVRMTCGTVKSHVSFPVSRVNPTSQDEE